MPDNLKKTTLLQQLGNHGSEWLRGKIEGMSFQKACNFIRGQCILNKFTNQKSSTPRRANELHMKDTQVNKLRNIQWEAWKSLPDPTKEIWLHMRAQEKKTINGLPKLLWNKLS